MSLVPTYVYATDGLFYKNPTIRGEGWFVCFDDDDPPELVMRANLEKTPQEILKSIPVRFSMISKKPTIADRCFSETNLKFTRAKSWFFSLLSPIPPPEGKTGVPIWQNECSIEGISGDELSRIIEERRNSSGN